MSWKDAEADLMLGKPQRQMSTEGWKLYNVNSKLLKVGNRGGYRSILFNEDDYNKKVLPHILKEDEIDIRECNVDVSRGGSCSFKANGTRFGGNHLDYWANSIFNTDLNQ